MSVIWCPKNKPPDPKSILPWSEEAQDIWEIILKKHKFRCDKNTIIDHRSYYNSIYNQTFGTPLSISGMEAPCGTHQIKSQLQETVTPSGYVNKIVPLSSCVDPVNDESQIMYGQEAFKYKQESQEYAKFTRNYHERNKLHSSHTGHGKYDLKYYNEQRKKIKLPKMTNSNYEGCSNQLTMDSSTENNEYAYQDESVFHLNVEGFTQEMDHLDYSQSLFSQLDSQNLEKTNQSDSCSSRSSPPLDLSPDNETYMLLSQKYVNYKGDVHRNETTKKWEEDNDNYFKDGDLFQNTLVDGYVKTGKQVAQCSEIITHLKSLSPTPEKAPRKESELPCDPVGKAVKPIKKMQQDLKRNAENSKSSSKITKKNIFNAPFKCAKLEENKKETTADKFNLIELEKRPMKQPSIDEVFLSEASNLGSCKSSTTTKIYGPKYVAKMDDNERNQLTIFLEDAEEIAITLVYKDGSSQLREHVYMQKEERKAENEAIGVAIAYPVVKKLQFVIFPLNITRSNTTLFQFCCDTLNNLFTSNTKKLCFEAQELIGTLYTVYNYSASAISTKWNVLDPKVAGWLLNPDHAPVTFNHVLMAYQDLDQVECTDKESELCSDLSLLGPVMLQIYQRLKQQQLWQLFTKIEMPLLPILAVMDKRTIHVNTTEMLATCELLKKKLSKLEAAAHEAAGQSFNINSHPQLRLILFEKLKLDLLLPKKKVGTTTQGNKSTSEAVLTQLGEIHLLPKIILEYRQLQKLKSTYVDGMMAFVEDGHLRTNWDQIAAATGRLTSNNPNIQAIPKQVIEVKEADEQFIVGKEPQIVQIYARSPFRSQEGWTLIAADFKQIELRILAHLSGDNKLLHVFRDKDCQDIFVELASQWLDKNAPSINQQDREQTKRVVYSVMYGAGKERLSEYLKISPSDAKAIIQSFLLKFPGINNFNKACVEEARKNRYQVTVLNRRRYFPNIAHVRQQLRAQAERQAVNFCVQGSAADLCKVAMIEVEHSLQNSETLNGHILFQIHDELLLEVPDSQVKLTAELLKNIMESSERLCGKMCHLKVPLQVSLSIGKSWGHMEEFNLND